MIMRLSRGIDIHRRSDGTSASWKLEGISWILPHKPTAMIGDELDIYFRLSDSGTKFR